jgi:hypothetical protein
MRPWAVNNAGGGQSGCARTIEQRFEGWWGVMVVVVVVVVVVVCFGSVPLTSSVFSFRSVIWIP